MINNGKSLAGVVNELKGEAKEFAQTRLEMLKAEYQEKMSTWKAALPALGIAAVLLATAWFLLTATLVALVAAAFYPSRWAYFFGLAIVLLLYVLAGAVAGMYGYRSIKQQRLAPERTIKVLKEDRLWLQTEARTQV